MLTTRRLTLRPMTPADLPDLASMLQDPVGMAAYEGPFSDDEVRGWLDRQVETYQQYGYGLWAMVLTETEQVIGQCGITRQLISHEPQPELGYHVKRDHWHHGYATEAALACRDYAFSVLNFEEVFAQTRDTNIASMNVAIRVGMTVRSRFLKTYRGAEMPHFAFSVGQSDLRIAAMRDHLADTEALNGPTDEAAVDAIASWLAA